MQILNEVQIQQKIKRLTIEILEHNFSAPELILIGINERGMEFANLILQELVGLTQNKVTLTRLRLEPNAPTTNPIVLEMDKAELNGKTVILIDDVANTGRTIFYAFEPILAVLPQKVEVAVMVDRKHKQFPIKVDYVGLSLATTFNEHIDVQLGKEKSVFLR